MGSMMRASERFEGVRYQTKSSEELRESMTRKIAELRDRIAQREARLLRLREEYQLSPERLAELVMRYQHEGDRSSYTSYQSQGGEGDQPLVPAGVIANITRERAMIDSEREQIQKLELILRNLKETEPYYHPETGEHGTRACIHTLEDEELEYLGY